MVFKPLKGGISKVRFIDGRYEYELVFDDWDKNPPFLDAIQLTQVFYTLGLGWKVED